MNGHGSGARIVAKARRYLAVGSRRPPGGGGSAATGIARWYDCIPLTLFAPPPGDRRLPKAGIRHLAARLDFARDKTVATRILNDPMSSARPFLYVKDGCPWCDEAEDYLRDHGIAYGKADVYADPAAFEEMRKLSGQTKAPTMRWGNEILADFGAEELDAFLRERQLVK
jgi:glutaredoxin 3